MVSAHGRPGRPGWEVGELLRDIASLRLRGAALSNPSVQGPRSHHAINRCVAPGMRGMWYRSFARVGQLTKTAAASLARLSLAANADRPVINAAGANRGSRE